MNGRRKLNCRSLIGLVILLVAGVPKQLYAVPVTEDPQRGLPFAKTNLSNTNNPQARDQPFQAASPDTVIHRKYHTKIKSKRYRIIFPSPPATSKEEYVFAVSIGKNGELSYFATCPTSGTSIGLGILLGSATFADNNIKLPKACIEVQRATVDIINLKQGRDAADLLGPSYQIVLEEAIFLRSLRAFSYTQTQLNGLQNQLKTLNQFRPHKTDMAKHLTDTLKNRKEDQIEILQEDLNRIQSIILSTGHQYEGMIADTVKDSRQSPSSSDNNKVGTEQIPKKQE